MTCSSRFRSSARATGQSLIRMLRLRHLAYEIGQEFHRKVRTLRGISSSSVSRCGRLLHESSSLQLVSHKVMRLVVPYLLVLLLISALALSSGSLIFAAFAALQIFGWPSLSLACVTGFRVASCRGASQRAARTQSGRVVGLTNLSSHVARFGRYGLLMSRKSGLRLLKQRARAAGTVSNCRGK